MGKFFVGERALFFEELLKLLPILPPDEVASAIQAPPFLIILKLVGELGVLEVHGLVQAHDLASSESDWVSELFIFMEGSHILN